MGKFKYQQELMTELGREASHYHTALQIALDEGNTQEALNAEHRLRSTLEELCIELGGDDE